MAILPLSNSLTPVPCARLIMEHEKTARSVM